MCLSHYWMQGVKCALNRIIASYITPFWENNGFALTGSAIIFPEWCDTRLLSFKIVQSRRRILKTYYGIVFFLIHLTPRQFRWFDPVWVIVQLITLENKPQDVWSMTYTQGNYATVGSAIVAIAIVGRGGWAGLSFLNFKHTRFGLPQCLKTYHLSLYNIKKDMLLTGPFVYAFIWFSFATVYGRLPYPPLPTMAIATLAIATVSLGGTISLCTRLRIICIALRSI